MTVSYVFQLVSLPEAVRNSGDVFESQVEIVPPSGCVMLDWRLDRRGDVIIRWRKTPESSPVRAVPPPPPRRLLEEAR